MNKGLTAELDKAYNKVNLVVEESLQLFSFNDRISEVVSDFFYSFAKEAHESKHYELERKANRIPAVLKDLYKYPELQAPFKTLYYQSIVLTVSAMENYLKDIFSIVLKDDPTKVVIANPKISFKSELINQYGFSIDQYLDKILFEKGDINFQDLQSTVRAFENNSYLNLTDLIPNDEMKDNIIFLQAHRHSINHSAGIIDEKFIKQVRLTKYRDYYTVDEELKLSRNEIRDLINSVLKFCELIYNQIKQ